MDHGHGSMDLGYGSRVWMPGPYDTLPVQFQAYALSIQQHDDVRQVAANHSTWTECSCDTVRDKDGQSIWRNHEPWKITEKSVSTCYARQDSHWCFVCLCLMKKCKQIIYLYQVARKPKDASCLVKQHKTTIRKIEEQHVWCWNHWVQLWEHSEAGGTSTEGCERFARPAVLLAPG